METAQNTGGVIQGTSGRISSQTKKFSYDFTLSYTREKVSGLVISH